MDFGTCKLRALLQRLLPRAVRAFIFFGGFYLYFKSEKALMGLAIAEQVTGPYVQLPFPVTNNEKRVEDLKLDTTIKTYKKRWRIETSFRVQDEATIKCKSKEMKIRYFLFMKPILISCKL